MLSMELQVEREASGWEALTGRLRLAPGRVTASARQAGTPPDSEAVRRAGPGARFKFHSARKTRKASDIMTSELCPT